MHANQLDGITAAAKKLKIDRLRIHIYEQRGDFDLCMATYLNSEGCKTEDIFPWLRNLHKKINKLDEESISKIKEEILKVIQELVKAGSSQTSEVIDTWLPDSQGEIINKLSSNSELQLRYLQDYLNEREADIKEKILASGKSKRSNTEVHEYKRLLKLHVQLLADKFSPQLKQVVMKEYYPLDCLDEADDSSIIVKEAKAYL